MSRNSSYSAVGISIAVHSIILVALAMIQQELLQTQPDIQLETVFEDERVQEEFSQELDVETEIAETTNTIAGAVSTAIGGSGAPAVAQANIETSESLKEPDIKVNVGPIAVPGLSELGNDLGEGEVKGESGAMVEGYGAALDRMTQEIIRMMREKKVLVVWLFDESESMKDDQQEIRERFHKVYEELGIQQQQNERVRKGEEVLMTSILGFGASIHTLTAKPTANIKEVQAAIDKIAIDTSGDENMCQSISKAIDEYRTMANRTKRRLVVVVVSDESPKDGDTVEETIQKAQRSNTPVYILGREAIFGYPYARIRWKDPVYGLWHWVFINRGPETAGVEALQYDGLRRRHDSDSSGFGPYSQVRLAKETGGIFFVLPGEEQNLTGRAAFDKRKFDALAMKEYEPLLLPAREYTEQVNRSKFRKTISEVIHVLNPWQDNQLEVEVWHFPIDPAEFKAHGAKQFPKALRAREMLTQAINRLESVRPLRDEESSQRWRANYDLIVAQTLSYRVRLFQYLLAMDKRLKDGTKPENEKNNRWAVRRTPKMLEPDEQQIKATKVDLALLKEQENKARELFKLVIQEHPGTPWAQRAQKDLNQGFGIAFYERFEDPNYRSDKIKIPKF